MSHKYEGFTITCDKCGSTDCYIMQEGIFVKLVCNNHKDCGQEKYLFEVME